MAWGQNFVDVGTIWDLHSEHLSAPKLWCIVVSGLFPGQLFSKLGVDFGTVGALGTSFSNARDCENLIFIETESR